MSNASNADQFGRPRTATTIGLGALIASCAITGSVWPSPRGSVWASFDTLLPEVWLHWDPKTARERGAAALARFRMDFLLLLPGDARVVIEVDGKHHYADDDRRPNPRKYAEMMAADRDLRLAGYEVYRFGAFELRGRAGHAAVERFFRALFNRHGVAASGG